MAHWRDTGTLTPFQMLDIPPVWLLGFILLAALQVTFVPVQAEVPLVIRWIGAALVCAGMSLMIWAILAFRRHQTSVVPHQTPREEGRLKECFGPEYTAYAQKTRRWFGYQG